MSFDSAWIFRICLVMAVTLILFADFLGYGGANARKNDKSEDYEDYTAEDQHPKMKGDRGNQQVPLTARKGERGSAKHFPSRFLERTLREKSLDVLQHQTRRDCKSCEFNFKLADSLWL